MAKTRHQKRIKQFTKVIEAGLTKGLKPQKLIDKVVEQGYQAKVNGKTVHIDNLSMFVKMTHDTARTFSTKDVEEW